MLAEYKDSSMRQNILVSIQQQWQFSCGKHKPFNKYWRPPFVGMRETSDQDISQHTEINFRWTEKVNIWSTEGNMENI